MRIFEVWAPKAKQLELVIAEENQPMVATTGGWWRTSVEVATTDTRYAYRIDGAGPFPDPRSLRQPEGVDGPSQAVDHGTFDWGGDAYCAVPLSGAVVYELHIGTFTEEGTFDAAVGRMPELVELGVTHLEVMPVASFPGRHGWGYDGVHLFAVHEPYGGPDGFKRFVRAAHRAGLGVILDVVYNHLGPSGNHLPKFGPYFSDRHQTPWGAAMNLDGPDCGEVRRFFMDNALHWLRDYHCDGLRLDAVHAYVDASAIPFLEELAGAVHRLQGPLRRPLVLVAESDLNDPRVLWPSERGGYGLQAQWSDDFHHALHVCLTGERAGYYADFDGLPDLGRVLKQAWIYRGEFSKQRRRCHGRVPDGLAGDRFFAYSQNHDQVGNRAVGERLCHLVSPGRARIAAAVVLLSPFVPMLFMGEEWGASTPFLYFTDHCDTDLGRKVSEGRRREFAAFGWTPEQVPDPQDRETWRRSVLRWEERESGEHAALLRWYQALLRLRRTEPALTDVRLDQVRTHWNSEEEWLLIERGCISVLCNLSTHQQAVPLLIPEWIDNQATARSKSEDGACDPGSDTSRGPRLLLSSGSVAPPWENAVEMPPESVAILAFA